MLRFQYTLVVFGTLVTLGMGGQALGQLSVQSPPAQSPGAAPAQSSRQNPAYTYIHDGDRAYADGKFAEAVKSYTQALEIFDQNEYAYYNRGNAHRRLKDYAAAVEDYTLALQINPQDQFAYLYRGMSYQLMKQPEKAIEDFTALIQISDTNPAAYHHRAQSYVSLKQLDLARTDFTKSADLYRKQQESGLAEKVMSEMRASKR